MNKFLIAVTLAVILVAILVIVYLIATDSPYAQKDYWKAKYLDSPWEVYAKSSGNGLDEAALLALNRANGREIPTSSDHLLSATIISRNILEQEHVPTGNLRTDVENAHARRDLFDVARNHHMAALIELPRDRQRENRQRRDIPEQFIIDAATEFAFQGLMHLIMNDPLIMQFELVADIPPVDRQLAGVAATRREELINDHRAAAATVINEQGGAIAPGVQTYMDLAIQNTNDPQNSHDSGVLACLRAIVTRLCEDQTGATLPTMQEIRDEIIAESAKLSEGRAHRTSDVLEVLDKIQQGERVTSLGASDEECLARIWLRTKDPRNSEVSGQMRQAIFDALYDCWENGMFGRHIVCVNGRTSRILSSLILLDWDKRNWEVKKLEQFRNDIYAKTHELINEEAKRATKSADNDIRRAGALYLAKSNEEVKRIGVIPQIALDTLAQSMRTATIKMIDDYLHELEVMSGIKGAIPNYMIEATKQEALAAI
jgi:hypothetical protein